MGYAKRKSKQEFTSDFEVFTFIITHLWQLEGYEMEVLAKRADVSISTLYFWRNGDVMTPRIDTLTKVMKALGYEITWKKSKKPLLTRI